ncbi:MAG: hypothetical protein R3250_03020 [Melioribacteraceae bacterium]|nr:hypothetical protein [Melioribacteraceae bacterium]
MIPLSYLFERSLKTFGDPNRVNAPMIAWSVYHQKPPPFIWPNLPEHPKGIWKGLKVDKVIPTNALNQLEAIEEIKGTSSCQGTLTKEGGEKEVPTYFIFRPNNQDRSYCESITSKLNRFPRTRAGYGMGNAGKYRICVIGDMSYETDPRGFTQWWNALPKRIRASL